MEFEVKPYGNEYRFDQESDIIEVLHTESGLRIIVVTAIDSKAIFLEVFFDYVRGYRFLDEGDLIAYWESKKFDISHHTYEILSGGWSNGEVVEDNIMSVSKAMNFREWFIVTTNSCINVLSSYEEPKLREINKIWT
jgi:hypothetical protein